MPSPLTVQYSDLSSEVMAIPPEWIDLLREELMSVGSMRSGEYVSHDHVIRLPLDPHILVEAKQMAEKYYSSNLKFIILVGIGGQNLGVQAVYDALRGPLDLATNKTPKIIFLDTISAIKFRELEEIILADVHSCEEILISLSSKSGGTTETISNFEFLVSFLTKHIDGIENRIVVTTDRDSALHGLAEKKGYGILEMPKMVGGRFSVQSQSGIFPLLLAGIDVVSFREGASAVMSEEFTSHDSRQSAKYAAEAIFREMSLGNCNILNIFHFNPELESLGKWERQLIAESLGKQHDISGMEVHAGITPIVSIGSTDLHSMAQLYFGGPRDKFTMMVKASTSTTVKIPRERVFQGLNTGLSGRSSNEIMDAIYQGVLLAYHKYNLPVVEVSLPSVSAFSIGAYMQWRILVVIYLGKLLRVNPYDQPNVEYYKEETRKILDGLRATN